MEFFLRGQVDDVLAVEQRQIWGHSVAFGGRLRVAPGSALASLEARLGPQGYTPFLREERGTTWIYALPRAEVTARPNPLVNLALFLGTVLTTLLAGALSFGNVPLADLMLSPTRLLAGLPFSASLLAILVVHEFGHYTVGRHHGMPITLPYFIPVPPPFLVGTLGAFIRLRGPVRDRRSLFDMAVAGPLAGLVVAVPLYAIGLQLSSVARLPAGDAGQGHYLQFGDAVLPKLIEWLVLGPLPPGHDVLLHPIGVAAWFGFFVTVLNLMPAGQLDGGHLVYALFGRWHGAISKAAVGGLLVLGIVVGSPTWLIWPALIVVLMGFHHGPPMDDITPLDGKRRALGVFALALLFVLLPPVPLAVR
ncbi:MAG TPA: site-2 protease family protein [Methylomirabilota bacterium]|jgi:membrane-associated protease RseP (regulator of RpoE activity)|nr:site-2 protease family protein [Methylomirabilota bacterium]